MSFVRFGGGVVTRDDVRLLDPSSLRVAAYVEHRPGSDGLSETATFQLAGNSTPALGNRSTAGLIYAQWENTGAFLIADYGQNLAEDSAATSGVSGSLVALENGSNLTFESAPLVLSGTMFNDRLYIIAGVGVTVDGAIDSRNIVREYIHDSTGTVLRYRREGLVEPRDTGGGAYAGFQLTDLAITSSPSDPSFTYRCLYNSSLSSDQVVTGKHAPEDTDDSTAAVITVVNTGVTRHGVWDFRTITPGGQPSTGKGVLSIYIGGGPKNAWPDIGVGGAGRYSIDADIIISYSTNNGSTYTEITRRKAPFLPEWLTVDLTATTQTITSIKVKVEVTKNSGSLDAKAFIGTVKFDTGGGAGAAVNTTTDQGIHYFLTTFDSKTGRESNPCPVSATVKFSVGDYPNGVKYIDLTLPQGNAQEATADTYKVYRCPDGTLVDKDGNTLLNRYGLIRSIVISRDGTTQTLRDDFNVWPITEVPQPVLRHFVLGSGDNVRFFTRDAPPPVAVSQCVFKGSRILVKDGDSNIYFTHPYEWESTSGIYQIPSRSPRNDQPECVASFQEAWLAFYRDYTRRIQGLPLVLDGQFDATSYSEANDTRGACGPRAVTEISRDSESGNAWLFCVDKLGFYIRNESQIIPWSRNIIWTDVTTPANGFADPSTDALRKLTVTHNPFKDRIEIHFLAPSRTDDNNFWRLDVYYNRIREDGQPVILGPHYVGRNARLALGYDQNGDHRVWAASSIGVFIYLADTGILNQGNDPVVRDVETGYVPVGQGPGEDGYLKYAELFMGTDASNPGDVTCQFLMSRNGFETGSFTQNFKPTEPARVGVWTKAEFMSLVISDSLGGSTGYDRAEILGMELFFAGGDTPESAQRAGANRNFNTTTGLPIA